MKRITIDVCCGTCINNDDGFCDFLGRPVEDDDKPHCKNSSGWEMSEVAARNRKSRDVRATS